MFGIAGIGAVMAAVASSLDGSAELNASPTLVISLDDLNRIEVNHGYPAQPVCPTSTAESSTAEYFYSGDPRDNRFISHADAAALYGGNWTADAEL